MATLTAIILKARVLQGLQRLVPGAGHFVHCEKPRIVNRYILQFLDMR